MVNLIDQCLKLIVQDDVDQVLFAFGKAFVWLMRNKFLPENPQSLSNRFLDQIFQALKEQGVTRQHLVEDENMVRSYRLQDAISNELIEKYLKELSGDDGLDFLGKLIGKYALVVPEVLFRRAKSFLGMHQTPDNPPIEDHLPMEDDMILYCWQYYWFYSALGH